MSSPRPVLLNPHPPQNHRLFLCSSLGTSPLVWNLQQLRERSFLAVSYSPHFSVPQSEPCLPRPPKHPPWPPWRRKSLTRFLLLLPVFKTLEPQSVPQPLGRGSPAGVRRPQCGVRQREGHDRLEGQIRRWRITGARASAAWWIAQVEGWLEAALYHPSCYW